MMLPSTAPAILLVATLARRPAAGFVPGVAAFFTSGYLLVWIGFSIAATGLQWGLAEAGLLSGTMAAANRAVAGGVLIAAGLYQWSPLKDACLRHCRSPVAFLVGHWRKGAAGAVANGLRHGLFCLGCCWMLMALLFVGGVMNLAWVAAIALIVLVEKMLPAGRWMGRAIGGLFVAWGVAALASLWPGAG